MAKDKEDKKDSKALPTDPVLRKKEEKRRRELFFKNETPEERFRRGQMAYDMQQAEEAFAREEKTGIPDFKKGGLARKRRKSDGGLTAGKRKIAKGCGKVMGNRRKKTLYT